jgi:hypothetical protein
LRTVTSLGPVISSYLSYPLSLFLSEKHSLHHSYLPTPQTFLSLSRSPAVHFLHIVLSGSSLDSLSGLFYIVYHVVISAVLHAVQCQLNSWCNGVLWRMKQFRQGGNPLMNFDSNTSSLFFLTF